MTALSRRFSAMRDSGVLGQLVRFGIAGGLSSDVYSLVYITWIGTALLQLSPWMPLIPAIFLAAIVTFVLNRFWVFR